MRLMNKQRTLRESEAPPGNGIAMSQRKNAIVVRSCKVLLGFLSLLVVALPAFAAEPGEGGHGSVSTVIISLAIILMAAKLGGHLAVRIEQPPVLGELLAGVILGNLTLVGYFGLDYLKTSSSIEMLAEIGVIVLLFQVGLESTVGQMLKVGLSAFLVGTFGVIGPFVLGWGVGAWLLPEESVYAHIFLGATLTATSVGITARVLKDLGRSQSNESRIILGAAVIDDVPGFIILAVVTGIIAAANVGATMSYAAVGFVILKATMFLVGSFVIGV